MGTEIPVQIRGRRPTLRVGEQSTNFLVDAIIRIKIKANIAWEVALK